MSGVDLITPKTPKELSKKSFTLITYIFKAILRINYWPNSFKIPVVKLILKRRNGVNGVLCHLINLLVFYLFYDRISITKYHQFGFRKSRIQLYFKFTNKINKSFWARQYFSAVFLNVKQAFKRSGTKVSLITLNFSNHLGTNKSWNNLSVI